VTARVLYGRRSNLAQHESFLRYRGFRWLVVAVVLCGAAIAVFWSTYAPGFHLKHSGGSWLGYTLGTTGALLMLWLTAFGLRKRAITSGNWSLRGWLSAHVYLGLSLTVVVTLHTGFQFSWNLHTVAYALMLVAIASGAVGAFLYWYMPERLSDDRQGQTKKQMLEILRGLDARIFDCAQPLSNEQAQIVRLSLTRTTLEGGLFERLADRYPRCGNARALAAIPALKQNADAAQAETLDRIADLLRTKADTLKRLRRYVQIRAVLESWLYIHVPATFAMLAAVTAHIVSVFFYW
jgi:hypothetical protein